MRTFVAEFFYSVWLMREFIIADNQDISKAGMMFLLSKQKEVSLLLEADNKAELIQQLRLYPQAVIILDYTLFNFAGADELIVLQERFKEADWILFSDELSLNFLRQVLFSSMAFGVVMKDNSKEEIMTAIQCATRKQRYICNHVSNLLLSGTSSPLAASSMDDHLLTQTEKNILKEIALGKTTKEIAAEKNLSFHTINSHRKNIFRKLGVNNVHEATKYAMRAGIVDAIIRCGYRGYGSGALVEDSTYRRNIQGAINAGLRVGVYFYSQAINEAEAVEEASMVLSLVSGYSLPLGVYYDTESVGGGRANALSAAERTACAVAFCETIRSAGYSAGVYSYASWFYNALNFANISKYNIWIAQYRDTLSFSYKHNIWQYTGSGSVKGISKPVDMNIG